DVAARVIAEGIERQKAGYAAERTAATVAGRERQNQVLMIDRFAEATQNATLEIGKFYGAVNQILAGPQAGQFTDFINQASLSIIHFTETMMQGGITVAGTLLQGLTSFDPLTMMKSLYSLAGSVTSGLLTVFEAKSPSELIAREVGEPMGEGMGVGLVRR